MTTSGIADFDSPEFIGQLAGRFRDCQRLHESIARLTATTERRVEAMRRNTFLGLAEVGEALLQVGEDRPRGFDEWFRTHADALGFSERTADRCKAAARSIREHGFDEALRRALEPVNSQRPEPFLSLTLRLPVSPDQIPDDELGKWIERLRPAVAVFQQLEERAGAAGA